MILLTRLNNKTFILNAGWIEQIEALPDTTVTLTSGKKIVVKESVEVVQDRCLSFYKQTGLFRVAVEVKEGGNNV
jgi:flagellar protein FlbD